MGVSINMTPGPIGRNFGKQVCITPGWRSQCVSVLCTRFGEAPFTLVASEDLGIIEAWRDGASVYTSDEENVWKKIADALYVHDCVTITMAY